MKPIRTSLARAGAALVLLAGFSGSLWAQTASNTTINNAATLNYTVNGQNQSPICSSPTGSTTNTCVQTSFNVDTKVNVLVTRSDNAAIPVTPSGSAVMTFTVQNTGNAAQDILLSTVTGVPNGQTVLSVNDTFDPTSCSITDAGGAAILNNKLLNVAANAPATTIKVSCTIGSTNGASPFTVNDATLVALKATVYPTGGASAMAEAARVNAATPGVVLADINGSDDASRDASHSARSALKVAPAALTVSKTVVTLCDPLNLNGTVGPNNYPPKAIPGAFVRYTITIANGNAAGTASAFLTTLTDALDTNLNADVDLITGATKCDTQANGGVPTSVAGSGVRINWSGGSRSSFGGTTGTKYLVSSPTTYTNTQLQITNANWTTLLPGTDAGYSANELKPGDSVTVIFNAIVK